MASSGSGDLQDAFAALRAGDPESMKRIYALTAPRLYGKLLALMKDAEQARKALQKTYLCLWRQRHELSPGAGSEFDRIAAIAHRFALAGRFRSTGGEGLQSGQDAAVLFERGSGEGISLHMLDERDGAMLKAAYLEMESIEALSRRTGMPPGDVRERLAQLASGKGGQSHD